MIDLILPCLDEADALEWVLTRVPPGVHPIVVDNGSQDGSPELAASLGAQVVHCPQRGYGAACHAGLQAATATIVAFCDCDCSIDPAGVLEFAEPVVQDAVDLVVARRRPSSRSAWPVHARLANSLIARRIRSSTGILVHDVGPLRVSRRQALLDLDQQDRRSGYPLETVLLAARAGWRICETDIEYRPRTGRSKVSGSIHGTSQAIRDMATVLAR